MSQQTLRIGTRKSAMALAQTEEVARRLRAAHPGLEVEIVRFETSGDQDQTSKLLRHGGKGGAFVAEIRQAMRAGKLHAAMHSLKDVPGNEETPGLVIGATLPRDAANDALVLRPGLSLQTFLAAKGKGFMIGTNAVRRAAYLRRLYPEVTIIHYRGAADTRIAKLDRGDKQRLPDGGAVGPADALVMARSGLERIGMFWSISIFTVCRAVFIPSLSSCRMTGSVSGFSSPSRLCSAVSVPSPPTDAVPRKISVPSRLVMPVRRHLQLAAVSRATPSLSHPPVVKPSDPSQIEGAPRILRIHADPRDTRARGAHLPQGFIRPAARRIPDRYAQLPRFHLEQAR